MGVCMCVNCSDSDRHSTNAALGMQNIYIPYMCVCVCWCEMFNCGAHSRHAEPSFVCPRCSCPSLPTSVEQFPWIYFWFESIFRISVQPIRAALFLQEQWKVFVTKWWHHWNRTYPAISDSVSQSPSVCPIVRAPCHLRVVCVLLSAMSANVRQCLQRLQCSHSGKRRHRS